MQTYVVNITPRTGNSRQANAHLGIAWPGLTDVRCYASGGGHHPIRLEACRTLVRQRQQRMAQPLPAVRQATKPRWSQSVDQRRRKRPPEDSGYPRTHGLPMFAIAPRSISLREIGIALL